MIHQHDADCRDLDGNLICGRADFVIHTHDSFCYDDNNALICPLPEIFEHVHGEECYTPSDIAVCGYAEGEEVVVHAHTEECYSEGGELVCELPEREIHQHNELCFGKTLICEREEITVHIHSAECYDENGGRICPKTEILEHRHSAACMNTADTVDAPVHSVIGADELVIGELQPVVDLGGEVFGFDAAAELAYDGIAESVDGESEDAPEPAMPADPEDEDIAPEEENGDSEELPPEDQPEDGELDDSTAPEGETPPETDSEEIGEPAPHVHTDECYKIVYSCGLEEHTHSIMCYADINADIDVAEEYRALADEVELYGIPAADVYQVAASQLGYTESKRNFILDENGVRKGYNLYSAWYTGGDGAYTDWNATFVAFCLAKAEVSRETIPYNSGVPAWTVYLENAGILKHELVEETLDYGDIVFFDTDGNGIADRVGIFMDGAEDVFYTIEGDTPDSQQNIFAEESSFAELSFDGTMMSFDDSIEELSETVKESYVWDDDKIETHAVTEVMHRYTNGDIVGYVDVSEQTQSEEVPTEEAATLAEGRANSLNSNVPYKLYTGDYTDLDTADRTFVIRNVASGQALGIQPEAQLEAKQLTQQGNSVPYTTTWHFEDVGWTTDSFLISTNVDGNKYIGCHTDNNTALFLPIGSYQPNQPENPNIAFELNGDGTFKMRVTNCTRYYTKGVANNLTFASDKDTATSFELIKDNGDSYPISSNNDYMGNGKEGSSSRLHIDSQTSNFYIVTADGNNYLTLTADENGNLALTLKPKTQIINKPATLQDIKKYEIWNFTAINSGNTQDNCYTLTNIIDGRYLNLQNGQTGGKELVLTDNSTYGQVRFRINGDDSNGDNIIDHLGISGRNANANYIQLVNDKLMGYNEWDVNSDNIASTSISLYQNGKLVYPIFHYHPTHDDATGWADHAYYPPLSGNYAIVVNNNAAVNVVTPDQVPVVSKQLPNDGANPAIKSLGKITDDNILWSFEKFNDDAWVPHKYRIKIDGSHWLPINDSHNPLLTATHNWGGDGSKFDIVPIEGTNQCYIRRLDGSNNDPREYLVYDNGQYKYVDDPRNYGDKAKFELYSQFEQREDINNDIFAHWYEKGDFPDGKPNIVLKVGEKVKIYADKAGYIDLPAERITYTNNGVAEGSYYDAYYTHNSAKGESALHSVLAIDATAVGETDVKFTTEDGNSITVHVTVVAADDEEAYRTALEATYTTRRYRHLDVEIDAAFVIHVFRPDGSHYDVNPTNIKIESVASKIYNTSKELNKQKIDGWTTEYINDTSKTDMRPGGDKNTFELKEYVNPLPPEFGDSSDVEKYVPLNNESYITKWNQEGSDKWREYGYYRFAYNASDTYEGETVPSYTVNYFDGSTQENGQYEFLTKGWGWLEFYDGDTAVLECELSYEYNGKKYYTPKQTVVMEINETNNICPAAVTYGNIQGFDITVEIKDTELFESTVFEKVDQYGNAVPGAEFEFYKSDSSYNTVGQLSTKTTDKNGKFYFTYNDVWNYVRGNPATAEAEYDRILGTSSGSHALKPGDLNFVDGPLTMYQLRQFLGEYFIMKETKVPAGYRKLNEPIKLNFIGNHYDVQSTNLYLDCENVVETGVMVDPNAYVKAPGTLTRAVGGGTISYFDASGNPNGTLYAVILKRNGANRGEFSKWTPVTGNDYEGYEYHPLKDGENDNTEAIKRLLSEKVPTTNANGETVYVNKYEGEGVFTFKKDEYSSNPLYSASVKNMPGDITEYYQYLAEDTNPGSTDESEYMIAYYYQENKSSPPVMVRSGYGDSKEKFRINWSSTVKVPNNENRLFFQKLDYDGNLLNDTVFALYRAKVIGDKKYYVSGNDLIYLEPVSEYVAESGTTQPAGKATVYQNGDVNRGGISATYKINTMYWEGAKTKDSNSNEVPNTPDGYLHDVNKGAIYVTTEGASDTTHYINPVQKTGESYNYIGYTHSNADNDPTKPACDVVAEDGTGHFGKIPEGTYILKEIIPPNGFSLNPAAETLVEVNDYGVFAHAGTQGDGVSVGNGPGYLLSTMTSYATRNTVNETLRWIYTALRVNDSLEFPNINSNDPTTWYYAKPSQLAERKGWAQSSGDSEASTLVTTANRSEALVTYLQYKDKVDEEGVTRLFDYQVNDDTKEYTVGDQTITGSSARPTTTHTSGTTVDSSIEGSETLVLSTDVGWSALSVYQDYTYGHEATGMKNAYTPLIRDDTRARELTQLYSNSTFVRVADRALKITVAKQGKKVDANGETTTVPLEGAKFKIYRVTKDENGNDVIEYYNDAKGVVTWKAGIENGSELTTCEAKTVGEGSYSYFEIGSLGSGEYFLQEVEAPDGYMTLNPIPFTVNLENATDDSKPVVKFETGDNLNAFVTWNKLADRDDFYDAASGSEQYLVTLTDDNAGLKIQLKKVADGDSTKTLAGAEFVLYRDNDVVREYSSGYTAETASVNWVTEKSNAKIFKTGENGIAVRGDNNSRIQIVEEGTYYIEEVKAPPGYNMLTEPIKVEVTASANTGTKYTVKYTVPGKNPVTNEVGSPEEANIPVIEFEVPNTSGYELPQTGSSGELLYTLFGGLLMLLPIMCGYARRRRERRAAK